MLKNRERHMKLYAPLTEEGEGKYLGSYPMSFSYRSSEEVETGEVLYTNLRLSAYADRRRAPRGGYRRGMVITDESGAERYHVLVPVLAGRLWIMKIERVITNGDGEAER